MNRIAAQLALADAEKRPTAMDHDTIALVRSSMRSVPPDFWSVIGQTELDMYVSIAAGTLARDASRLIEDFRDHHGRVGNARLWSSVFDNATFVLSRYRTRANQAEAAAADRLLAALASLAGAKTRPAATGSRLGAGKDAPAPNRRARSPPRRREWPRKSRPQRRKPAKRKT